MIRALVVSALCALAAASAHAQTAPTLRVRGPSGETVLSAADLRALPHRSLRVAPEGSPDSATVSGFALWDALQHLSIPPTEASGRQRAPMYVRLVGADGQTAIFALVELDPGFSKKTVLVADQRDGHPLDSIEGPLRVFAPDDQRHARWIRGLVRVDVGTLPP